MSDVSPWQPSFPGQRPPFQPGHELTLKHGAFSVRKVAPLAAELVEAVMADESLGYLRQPSYGPAVAAWAAAEARVILVERWVDSMTLDQAAESGQGKTSPLELLRKWEASASNHRARLGLDPLSRARLGRDVTAASVDAVRLLTAQRTAAEKGQGNGEDDA